jgi:AcrR family transcriptional regulator
VSQPATERKAGPGRPSTGARERILDAALETLKADGYAGLTLAKVAARAGENKALVSYHYGSKQGLIAAAARELGETITQQILVGVKGARSVEEIVRGALAGTWMILEQDERLPRVYFDLNAVSIVEDDVRAVMREVKHGFRTVLADLLRDAEDAPPSRAVPALVLVIIAGLEGFSLEWIERGDTAELRRAKDQFVRSIVAGLA